MEALTSVLSIGTRSNRILRGILAVMAIGMSLRGVVSLLVLLPIGYDAYVPFDATQRWVSGGQPYLASAFAVGSPQVPFLYPPPVLLLLSPSLVLPRAIFAAVATCVGLVAAVAALDRLGIPRRWIAIVLLWTPFAEALIGANIQPILFLAFVLLYVQPRAASRPWRPAAQDPRTSARPAFVDGLLAASIGALKLSQGYAWVNLLRRRPQAAVAGAVLAIVVALTTVPFVGIETWRAWIDQLARATDPTWELAGFGLETFTFPDLRVVLLITGLVFAFFAPADDAGASVGAVLVVFGQSLRVFGIVFLVPAMLRIRVEIALAAALLVATYTVSGIWAGIGVVVGAQVASRWFPALLEPDPGPGAAAASVAPSPAMTGR